MADTARAFEAATKSDKPVLIACKTIIGYGSPKKAGTAKAHGEALGAEELAAAKAKLGWSHGPFEIPDDILNAWRKIGARGSAARQAWAQRLKRSEHKNTFAAAISGANVDYAVVRGVLQG